MPISEIGLEREPLARATEARHHLVEDEQDIVLVCEGAHAGEVAGRRHENARRSGDRLDEDRGDGGDPFGLDHALQVVQSTLRLLLDSLRPELGTVGERSEEVHVTARVFVRHPAPVPRRPDRRTSVAVIRTVLRQDLVAPGDDARHPDSVLVRVGTAVGEEHLVEYAPRLLEDALGRLAASKVRVAGRDHREHIRLLLDRRDHLRMLVPDVHIDELAGKVEILLSVVIPHRAAERPGGYKRLQRALRGPGVEDVGAVEIVGELAFRTVRRGGIGGGAHAGSVLHSCSDGDWFTPSRRCARAAPGSRSRRRPATSLPCCRAGDSRRTGPHPAPSAP